MICQGYPKALPHQSRQSQGNAKAVPKEKPRGWGIKSSVKRRGAQGGVGVSFCMYNATKGFPKVFPNMPKKKHPKVFKPRGAMAESRPVLKVYLSTKA
jgi:hypothetical protein